MYPSSTCRKTTIGGNTRVFCFSPKNLVSYKIVYRLGIPSFATLSLDSDTPEQPFANSLTLTSHDFKNFLHKDNDFHAITYGMWWATSSGGKLGPHAFADDIDHGSIHGGHFFNAEFNIGVDFTRYSFYFLV